MAGRCTSHAATPLTRILLLVTVLKQLYGSAYSLDVRAGEHLAADVSFPFRVTGPSAGGGPTSSCAAVQLSLEHPLDKYQVLVQQEPHSYEQQEHFCEIRADLVQPSAAEEVGSCNTVAVEVPGKPARANGSVAHWLRLRSSCSNVAATLRVIGEGAAHSRRQLGDLTPLYAPLPSPPVQLPFSPAPAASNQSASTAAAAAAPSPPGGGQAAVACCCGQNNQNGPATYGQCCCGPVALCCQSAGFCVTQNCTAIFVGSTLIAGALISFMTCGVCIYRARVSMEAPRGFWGTPRHGQHGATPRQLQLVPVRSPPAADEGKARECPVCLEETRANAAWVVFPCAHATCRPCYERLTAKPQQDAACPLCRAPLKEPVSEAPPSAVVLHVGVGAAEPAQPSAEPPAAQAASYAAPAAHMQPHASSSGPGRPHTMAGPSPR